VLQMQKYHSIADVALKLKRVTETKLELDGKMTGEVSDEKVKIKVVNGHVVEEEEEDDSPDSDITDSGQCVCVYFSLSYIQLNKFPCFLVNLFFFILRFDIYSRKL